jgi:mono/diheme cytochrome c family protein
MKQLRKFISLSLFVGLSAMRLFAGTPEGSAPLAASLGISFPNDNSTTLILERDGRRYLVDVAAKSISDVGPGAASPAADLFQMNCVECHGPGGKGTAAARTPDFTSPSVAQSLSASQIAGVIRNGKAGRMPPFSRRFTDAEIASLADYVHSLSNSSAAGVSASNGHPKDTGAATSNVYEPGDDLLFSLPTGRAVDEHGVYVNFTHRFPYDAAFTGPGRGGELFGLDNFALASLGFRYGVTNKLSVSFFRSPSLVGRPIQLMAAYNILDEHHEAPLNMAVRFSIEGQNNFRKNFAQNIETIFSRSITSKGQVYVVPTVSFNARPLVQSAGFLSSQIPDLPGVDTFSIGEAPLTIFVRRWP